MIMAKENDKKAEEKTKLPAKEAKPKEVKSAKPAKKKQEKEIPKADAKAVSDAFDIVKFVLMTEKSIRMVESQNKLVFIVNRSSRVRLTRVRHLDCHRPVGKEEGVREVQQPGRRGRHRDKIGSHIK